MISYAKIKDFLFSRLMQRRLGLTYRIHVKKPFVIIGAKNISIGKSFCAERDVRIEAWSKRGDEEFKPKLIIGNNVFLNVGTHIRTIQEMNIGDNVLTGSYVSIIDNNHGNCCSYTELNVPPRERKIFSKGPITIGNNVWIGDKACILGGVTIGDGAVIGANSVVTHSIPAHSIAVGSPARVIKILNEDNLK